MRKWYDNLAMEPKLHISQSPAAQVTKLADGTWRLEIPANTRAVYRLAQLDDHGSLRRRDFPWEPPFELRLQARVSAHDLPGTWGFGLWNEPFSFLIAYGGLAPRFPTLPDAAWFFHASPQNYLSFRNDLPSSGFLAATFHSKKVPAFLLALASPLLAFALLPGTAQVVRLALRSVIHQDAIQINTHVTDWHAYGMQWNLNHVRFTLDDKEILQTSVTPNAPLCLVIWIDNQYAALSPRGRLRFGSLPNSVPAWLEVREISVLEGSRVDG